jgi:Fe-S-cluster-containing hydrogenase component 2
MAKRKIIEIDRELCNGCGLCTTACMEGALELDEENKAVLVKDIYCDGMGACLDVCPTDALKIVERESPIYDPQAAYQHILKTRGKEGARHVQGIENVSRKPAPHFHAACPGSMAREVAKDESAKDDGAVSGRSELTQWPIQLHLISPLAPYFQEADLLIAADCTAFSMGGFHRDLLKGKKLVIACPKLDDTTGYIEKLAEIFKRHNIKSLSVAIMTVPCCSGLYHLVEEAATLSDVPIKPKKIIVGIDGKII